MVDVNALTDDELRTKLVEYGFPVMPITGTTRNLMAKKLKLLMESKPTNERRSLGKFSSDEESDAEVKVIKKDKNRRVTMAVPPMQQAKVQLSTEEKSEMDPPTQVPKEKKKGRSAKIIVQVKDAQDTNSDSEPEIEIEVQKKPASIKEPTPPPARPAKPLDSISSRVTTMSTSTSRFTTYTSPTTDSSERLEQMRSRLSLGATRKGYYNSESAFPTSNLNGEDTPFLSNFTRRLSQMSPRTDLGSGDFDSGSTVYSRSNYTPSTVRSRARDYSKSSYVSSTEEEPKKPTSSNVSFILIAVVILFFIALAALYYGMHSGEQVGAIVGKASKYLPQDRV